MNMMNTKIERVNPEQIDETIMEEAGRLIAEGELVAFPTETVYGLGGDALHPEAARKIYAAKGRSLAHDSFRRTGKPGLE